MRNRPRELLPSLLADWRALFLLPGAIWLPIVALSVIALGSVLFNESSVKRIRADSDQLAALMEMRRAVFELRAGMADSESGQRGYLLTRDSVYLEHYRAAIGQLALRTASMLSAAASDPALLAQVRKVESLRAEKLGEMSATIKMVEQGVPGDALVVVQSGEGRSIMNAFRTESQVLLDMLQARSQVLRASANRDVQWSRAAFAGLGLLTLALLLAVIRLLVRDFWQLEQGRQEARSEQVRLEQEVTERTAELSNLTTYLQTLAEQEKADLAHNLHDELGGLLTAAKMDLAWLQGRASAAEPQVRSRLEALAHGIDEAMNVKRRVVENLRPALLEHFGLPTALQAYFDETCAKAGLQCRATVPESFDPIPQELAITLFRVSQESLTNIIRHARASNVELSFAVDAQQFRVTIVDDGVGIGPVAQRGSNSHGLAGMRHRVESLNGTFNIRPNTPRGTRIDVVVPRPPSIGTEGSPGA